MIRELGVEEDALHVASVEEVVPGYISKLMQQACDHLNVSKKATSP